jgi:hypothetical protein
VTTAFDLVRSGRAFTDLRSEARPRQRGLSNGKVNVIGLFEPVDPATKIMTAAAASDRRGRQRR